MNKCKLIVRDAVNVRFEGLDVAVRRKISDALKFKVPEARHMPLYKLGRWDGTVSFCSIGGATYLNLLDRILPILGDAKVEIEIDDQRPLYDFRLARVHADHFADRVWPPGHPLAGRQIELRDYQVNAINQFIDNLQGIAVIATAAGKCLDQDTLLEIDIDETTEFGKFLLNTVNYQKVATGTGVDRTFSENSRATVETDGSQ
jgi:hypothetical protein